MSLHATIQAALRTVPGLLAPDSSWSYRRLTSGPVSDDKSYSAWITVAAHVTGKTTTESFDADRSADVRKEVARFRISDALTPELHQGDQVKDGSGNVWAVMGIVSSGIGTAAYMIERNKALKAEPDRKAGV